MITAWTIFLHLIFAIVDINISFQSIWINAKSFLRGDFNGASYEDPIHDSVIMDVQD